MLTVGFVYPKDLNYFQGDHQNMLHYNFFFTGMSNSKRIKYRLMPVYYEVDARTLKGCDVLVFFTCAPTKIKIKHLMDLKCLKCVRGQDPPDMKEDWVSYYRFSDFKFVFFHAMKNFYPKICNLPGNIPYECVMGGVCPEYFKGFPWLRRVKDKILHIGSWGNEQTILRHKMMESPSTIHIGPWYGFVGNGLGDLLNQFKAGCTSMKDFMIPKYVEFPMAGCLTFMGASDTNGIDELGFMNGESCVYVTLENYQQKFEEYFATIDDPKWEQIASAGRVHAEKVWSNVAQVNKFIDILERYV